ncbi:MAG: hypothetical protein VR73_13560 [Gammaproteobacteria bacterium BRH_c0]|nr:MAG: hypothetical protein VR73_13560 [Gammaproteobacteria bacterium BRH_c0]
MLHHQPATGVEEGRSLGNDLLQIGEAVIGCHQSAVGLEAHTALLQVRVIGVDIGGVADNQVEFVFLPGAGHLGEPAADADIDIGQPQ